jgi:hypothetical protein
MELNPTDTIHHQELEGHEDRTKERAWNLKENVFFLRALRVLRGDIPFSFGYGSAAL